MRSWLIPLCCLLPLVSCDKIRDAVGKAKSAVNSASKSGESKAGEPAPGGEIDPSLNALVDRDAEGIRFRKDLEFPSRVKSRKVERTRYHDARATRRSALGTESLVIDGTSETVSQWRRLGDRIELSLEKLEFTLPPEKQPKPDPKKPAPVSQEPSPTGNAIAADRLAAMKGAFVKSGALWRAENARSGDFLRATWLQNLEPNFGEIATEAGTLPRAMWFGKRRWKEGAAMTLEGENLQMIEVSPNLKGKLHLTYEGVDAVGGHPCGRFAVSGSYSIEGEVMDDGSKMDGDMTITSGKIWCSVLYPVVMREELDTILTASSNAGGVPSRIQGRAVITKVCEWKPEP